MADDKDIAADAPKGGKKKLILMILVGILLLLLGAGAAAFFRVAPAALRVRAWDPFAMVNSSCVPFSASRRFNCLPCFVKQ